MSAIKPNKTTALALDTKAIAGVTKYFAKVKTITVAGTTYTSAALRGELQAEIDANEALDTSRAEMQAAGGNRPGGASESSYRPEGAQGLHPGRLRCAGRPSAR